MDNEKKLKTPAAGIGAMLRSMPGYTRITFIAAVIAGFATHLYMLTNKLPNHDDIGHMLGETYGTPSGRWLLPLMEKLDGDFSMPWLIGVLSIIALAFAACYIVSLMRIRSSVGCVVTAAVFMAFPTVAGTFSYMFSADAYFFSLALACFAVYITNRYRFGFLAGIACVAMSLGIYQSYFGVAAALSVAVLLFDVLDGELSIKELIIKTAKLLATLVIGLLAYYIIVKLTTRGSELVDYMGISDMGKISLSKLPGLIEKAYLKYGSFFIFNDSGVHFGFLKYAYIISLLCGAFVFVRVLVVKKLKPLYIAVACVLVALFPLAGNIIYVMVPDGGIHALMLYGLVLTPVLAIALTEYSPAQAPLGEKKLFAAANVLCSWVLVGTIALSAFSYAIYTNNAYMKMDMAYREAYSYSTRLISAAEQTEGYNANMPIVLVGNSYPDLVPELNSEVDLTGVFDMAGLVNSYTYGLFVRNYAGYDAMMYITGTEISDEFSKREEVRSMPDYPCDGSIQIIEDYVVVKMGPIITATS